VTTSVLPNENCLNFTPQRSINYAECAISDTKMQSCSVDPCKSVCEKTVLTWVLADIIGASGSSMPDSVAHISGDQYSNTLLHSSCLLVTTAHNTTTNNDDSSQHQTVVSHSEITTC